MEQMTPELAQALAETQALINQYNEARSRSNHVLNALPQEQALVIIQKFRRPDLEEQAINTLRDVLTSIYGRDPSPEELKQGLQLNPGLGSPWITVAAGVTIVLGGLVSLSGLFRSLFGQESSLQQELGITSASSFASKAFKASVWLASMAAVGYGGFYLYGKLAK